MENEENPKGVFAYHMRTKHGRRGFAPGPGFMDWANQPDPFRRYDGAEFLALPLVAGPADVDFSSLDRAGSVPPRGLDAENLSLFLELSLGLTAWKEYQGSRWALRANPSSGNLHPSECTLLAPPIEGVCEQPGIFHYAPLDHGLELLQAPGMRTLAPLIGDDGTSFLAILSSVHWRESWKYCERAYRYCQHDAGHALGSIRYAAALLGWRARLLAEPSDAELAALAGLDRTDLFAHGESEVPDFCIAVDAGAPADMEAGTWGRAAPDTAAGEWLGTPNRLSEQHVRWRAIDDVEASAAKPRTESANFTESTKAGAERSDFGIAATDIIRRRRSAVAMDGTTGMDKEAFLGVLARTLPRAGSVPWDGFPFAPALSLALFVHRVGGLPPGLYLFARGLDHAERLRAVAPDFIWREPVGGDLPLYLLTEGDLRNAARAVSCGQDIAADGAFSLGMIADFSGIIEAEGPWAYRRLHWEAGLIGQVLYLEAEAAGRRATGIGCFFDDEMMEILGHDVGPEREAWRSLYHFTVGGAVDDDRLATLDAYHHLPEERRTRA